MPVLLGSLVGATLACSDSSSNNPGRDAGEDGAQRDSALPVPDGARPDAEAPVPICGTHTGDGVYVKSVSPADKAVHVLRRPTLVVSFEGEISCPKTQTLTLSGPAGAVALGPPPESCGSYQAQPAQDLEYGATYTLMVAGLVDIGGKPLPAC
jgi:hypothetical protein